MIKEFECHNFRNIFCENLKFERINIMIGPNNAGKSNFIRALSFAANMVNEQSDGSYLKKDGSNFVNVFEQTVNDHPEFKKQLSPQTAQIGKQL